LSPHCGEWYDGGVEETDNKRNAMVTRKSFVGYMVSEHGYDATEADEMFSESGCDPKEVLTPSEMDALMEYAFP
jgi:hypothetical protein